MSDYAWGAFFVITIIAFSIAGSAIIVKLMEGAKECKANPECPSTSYCGSDFSCHPYPSIENTIIKNDWTTPAAILGLAIVVSALILRKRQR